MSRFPQTSSSQDDEVPVLSAESIVTLEPTPPDTLDLPTNDSKSEATGGGGADPFEVTALADISSILLCQCCDESAWYQETILFEIHLSRATSEAHEVALFVRAVRDTLMISD